MPKCNFNIFNDRSWARCPCGWSWEGADNGRGTKDMVKRLHAKKCEVYAYCLAHPEQFVQNVATYQGGGDAGGRFNLGANYNGTTQPIADMVDRLDVASMIDGVNMPRQEDTADERARREKKAKENKKKRLAKKKAKAKKELEAQEKRSQDEGGATGYD